MIRIRQDRYADGTQLEILGKFSREQADRIVQSVKDLGLPIHVTLTESVEEILAGEPKGV